MQSTDFYCALVVIRKAADILYVCLSRPYKAPFDIETNKGICDTCQRVGCIRNDHPVQCIEMVSSVEGFHPPYQGQGHMVTIEKRVHSHLTITADWRLFNTEHLQARFTQCK